MDYLQVKKGKFDKVIVFQLLLFPKISERAKNVTSVMQKSLNIIQWTDNKTHQVNTIKPILLTSSIIFYTISWQLLTWKFLFCRCSLSTWKTSLILDSSKSTKILNNSVSLNAEWVKYPSLVFSNTYIQPSSIRISLLEQPTKDSQIDFIMPPLFSSSNALTSKLSICPFRYDAHLYLGYFSNLHFPFIVQLLISSSTEIFILFLLCFMFSFICEPSYYFYFLVSSKSRSEGIVGSRISVPICGQCLSSPISNIYWPYGYLDIFGL